ncbi:hypothetical protein [Cyclobacterium sp.]|uniref:hypothetical protein n=1 Tax=Cyclobacterium sp. TaxID=1966343 RepID=UPI0019AB8104|nr:hypothetical protein [Cyclobacterium sp.]MBD3630003.1 hypothetical protein [Cyclobacterium sp.]
MLQLIDQKNESCLPNNSPLGRSLIPSLDSPLNQIMNISFKIKKLKNRFIIGSVAMATLFMAFGSYGSFNPFEIGFYTSIGAGIGGSM